MSYHDIHKSVISNISRKTDEATVQSLLMASHYFWAMRTDIIKDCKQDNNFGNNQLKSLDPSIITLPYSKGFDIAPYIINNLYYVNKHLSLTNNSPGKVRHSFYSLNRCSVEHIISSIKVKGPLESVRIKIAQTVIVDLNTTILSILPSYKNGFIEVLAPFLNSLVLQQCRYQEVILEVVHSGPVECVITHMHVDNSTTKLIRSRPRITQHLIQTLLLSTITINVDNCHSHSSKFQVLKIPHILAGLAVIPEPPCTMDTSLSITLTLHLNDVQIQLCSKACLASVISKTSLYNLKTPLRNCYYIPLDNVDCRKLTTPIHIEFSSMVSSIKVVGFIKRELTSQCGSTIIMP